MLGSNRHSEGHQKGSTPFGNYYTRLGSERKMMDSADVYETHAHEFLRGRDASLIGTEVVEQWSRYLPNGATIIELACGGGYPITRALYAAGLQIWAIDSSPTLVAEFRSRFPSIPVQCARVQESDLFGRHYQAAIAIGLIFLLPEQDQAELISRVSEILEPGGRFLFTAPLQIDTWKDMNTGIESRSLGQARYEELLWNVGLKVVAKYEDVGKNNYYDVEKIR